MKKRYQVFISSTFSDLKEHRRKVWETLISLDYIVAGMEFFPPTNEEQFQYIKREIEASDYYLLILAGRYGSMHQHENISFTEKEFNFALERSIPTLVFPIESPTKVRVEDTDQDPHKSKLLAAFRERACAKRVVHKWSNPDDLCLGIIRGLQHAIHAYPRPGWIPAIFQTNEDLIAQNAELRAVTEKLDAEKKILTQQVQADRDVTSFLTTVLRVPYTYALGPASFLPISNQNGLQKGHFDLPMSDAFYDAAEIALSTQKSSEKIGALTNRIDARLAYPKSKTIEREFIRDLILILASRDLLDWRMVGHEYGTSGDWQLTKLGQHIFANMRLKAVSRSE